MGVPAKAGFSRTPSQPARADSARGGWTATRRSGCSLDVSLPGLYARRSVALLWLVLFVLTRLSVAAHEAFTPHVACPVDGELAHAHADVGEGRAERGAHDPSESGAPEGEDHAEHCGFEPATQPASAATLQPVPAVARGKALAPTCPAPTRARAAERLFLLAPKGSPPPRAL